MSRLFLCFSLDYPAVLPRAPLRSCTSASYAPHVLFVSSLFSSVFGNLSVISLSPRAQTPAAPSDNILRARALPNFWNTCLARFLGSEASSRSPCTFLPFHADLPRPPFIDFSLLALPDFSVLSPRLYLSVSICATLPFCVDIVFPFVPPFCLCASLYLASGSRSLTFLSVVFVPAEFVVLPSTPYFTILATRSCALTHVFKPCILWN
ncbi:hypothetical protein BJV78DRAFT_807942 [Lactifluus subvellereus]|nr:hypothetical protein BJV78DRAFT_807942 [Lactifluus subvellereus]